MIATLFPLFTPVTDRLIGRFAPSVFGMVPTLDGSPLVQCAGFLLADVILAGLAVWDWRRNQRRVFPVALAIVRGLSGVGAHLPPLRLLAGLRPVVPVAAAVVGAGF